MSSLALLLLRLVMGGLLAGHGAQKLFGKFGGRGPEGTGRYLETLGLRPGHDWALVAGASELGGGALTALGFLSPLGPIVAMAPMITDTEARPRTATLTPSAATGTMQFIDMYPAPGGGTVLIMFPNMVPPRVCAKAQEPAASVTTIMRRIGKCLLNRL